MLRNPVTLPLSHCNANWKGRITELLKQFFAAAAWNGSLTVPEPGLAVVRKLCQPPETTELTKALSFVIDCVNSPSASSYGSQGSCCMNLILEQVEKAKRSKIII